MAKAKIYLYKEGNECTSLTGGIVGKYNTGGTNTLGTFTKQDKYISCVNNSTTKQVYVTSANKIDLTNYCNFICDFDVVNVRNTSSDVYKPTLTVRSNFTGNSELLTRGELIANLRQTLTLDITNINYSSNACLQTHANDYNIYKMYFETKENILTINSQEDNNIAFSANDLGLVTMTKIDVLINGVVSKTYTDEYSNLSYTVDKSLCYIGNNNIEIRVTYSQGDEITETSSEYLTYKNIVPQLPFETPLLDTIERVKLLTKSKQYEKNMLSSILTSKNVEVSEEDKMSDLIGKVNELGDVPPPPLYLYKEGDECVNITGGWTIQNVMGRTPKTIEKQTNRLYVDSASDAIGIFKTLNAISLSNYNKLCVDFECTITPSTYAKTSFEVRDGNDFTSNSVIAFYKTTISVSRQVVEIDISNITSSLYIGSYTNHYTQNSTSIYNIWLEE